MRLGRLLACLALSTGALGACNAIVGVDDVALWNGDASGPDGAPHADAPTPDSSSESSASSSGSDGSTDSGTSSGVDSGSESGSSSGSDAGPTVCVFDDPASTFEQCTFGP
jgi:hypothetical protein